MTLPSGADAAQPGQPAKPQEGGQYHSQIGQDRFLDEIIFRGKRGGFYVEIGAVDGLHFSNTLFFEHERGWKGICIEPNPIEFKKLLASKRDCAMENVAISDREGEFPFLAIDGWGKGLSGLMESYDPRHIERIKRETEGKGSTLTMLTVKTAPLKAILDKHGVTVVDYCSIDCEGAEMQILESIDFDKVHIRCLTIENNYGLERETRFLKEKGYSLYRKIQWDDVFVHRDDMPNMPGKLAKIPVPADANMQPETFAVSWEEVLKRLNPHFSDLFDVKDQVPGERRPALDFLTHRRFDIAAKYVHANDRLRGLGLDWAKNLYDEHIGAFNGFFECDGSGKQGRNAFREAFDRIIDSLAAEGFDPAVSVVPATLDGHAIDGSHRIGASISLGQPVTAYLFDHHGWRYDAAYFLRKGLSRAAADACIHACCRLKKNLRLAMLFPSAAGQDERVEKVLLRHGKIWYKKHVTLRKQGQTMFMAQVYAGEAWLGTWDKGFPGARSKAEKCFTRPGPMRVYVFEPDSPEDAMAAKETIRSFYGIEKHSIHINDSHQETVRMAGVLFNDNSVRLLNRSGFAPFPNFQRLLARWDAAFAARPELDPEDYCLAGSVPLAAYGLRDCKDLDYLSLEEGPGIQDKPYIARHDSQAGYYATSFEDIIYNPANHLYFFGVKIASLETARRMKRRRGEEKDVRDVALIDALAPELAEEGARIAPFAPVRVSGEEPEFALVVSNYNNGAYLDQSIRSALAQTVGNWEMVIVDDCSRDDSLGVIEKYLDDKRIRLVRHNANQGYVAALRTGIAATKAPYIGILDADDALLPNAVEVMLEQHRANPNASYVYSQFIYCDANLVPQKTGYCGRVPVGKTNLETDLVSHFKTFKRDAYEKTSGFDPEIMFAEDKDISYKLEEVGNLLYVDQDLYLYRVLPQSESHHQKKRRISLLTMKKAKCNALLRRAQACLKPNSPFKHLAKCFEFFSNEHFAMAKKELAAFQEKFHVDQLPRLDSRPAQQSDIAAVVVTYGAKEQAVACVKSLLAQTTKGHEVIVVDNGGNDEVLPELISLPILYVRSPMNLFPSLGRNIGAALTNAPVVCFIDDDALVAKDYMAAVRKAFAAYEVAGLRGRILPKTPELLSSCPDFYDPGLVPTPSSFAIEGNTAVLREVYQKIGGMDPLLFGGEGLDLSYRIAREYGPWSIVYYPDCLIFHDPSEADKTARKAERYKRMHKYLEGNHPDIWKYYRQYEQMDAANRTVSEYQRLLKKRN